MNKLDKDYQALLQDILDNGHQKGDRTGTGTISVFGRQIRHNMKDGFPLLTTKRIPFKLVVTELLWFLRGDTNIKYLVDNDCHIWDGDAYKNYEKQIPFQKVIGDDSDSLKSSMIWKQKIDHSSGYPIFERFTQEEFINKIKTDDEFAKKWGDLGPIYGKQWRSWGQFEEYKNAFKVDILEENKAESSFSMGTSGMVYEIDQIAKLIYDLKTNPDSRRLMVNAWNVGELDQMTLPPCHYGFQVYTRELSLDERMDLMVKKHKMIFEGGDDTLPTRAISLMWNQRSVDTFLGLPFNIASYGLLLEIIAKAVNMVPDQLIGNLGDTHLYSNHIEQAKEQIGREFTEEEIQEHLMQSGMDALKREPRMEYISKLPKRTREPYPLPKLVFGKTDEFFKELGCDLSLLSHLETSDFVLENYQSHPTIKAPLSN